MRFFVLGGLFVALGLAAPAPLEARDLISQKVTEQASLPSVRPDWPVPSDADQLFYVQRSTNSNTVVYAANFDANGQLDSRRPMLVYWRRFDTNGARRALSFLEARFGYGVNARREPEPGTFTITPRALSKIKLQLRQTAPGKAELRAPIGGRLVRPVYAFVGVDETGLIARVVSLSVHGIDPATGRAVSETFRVSGGEILQ